MATSYQFEQLSINEAGPKYKFILLCNAAKGQEIINLIKESGCKGQIPVKYVHNNDHK